MKVNSSIKSDLPEVKNNFSSSFEKLSKIKLSSKINVHESYSDTNLIFEDVGQATLYIAACTMIEVVK